MLSTIGVLPISYFTYFLNEQYDEAWQDVKEAQKYGCQVDPKFLHDLKKKLMQ